jgi:hypothetical protein
MIEPAVELSIVIVTWNAHATVRECLSSLQPYMENPTVEVIVVDNASSDGTPELMRRQFPKVRLVENKTNIGFAGANNIGITLSAGRFICLVNSDVVVPGGCFERLLGYMKEHPGIGLLGPVMRLPNGGIGQSCMRFPSVANWLARALAFDSVFKGWRRFGGLLMTDFAYDRPADVDVLTGWFWMTRREALNEVGLLDERFFMYGEDMDWSKRFHLAGWRVVFCPDAYAIHYCGASSSREPTRFYIEMTRANLQYCRRHHNRVAVIGFWLAACLHDVLRVLGYGLLFLANACDNAEAASKIKRSAKCLFWLLSHGVSSVS